MKLAPGTKFTSSMTGRTSPAALRAAKKTSERDRLVNRFVEAWRRLGGPALEPEYAFLPPRQFRLDFAHAKARVGVEIHGATYTGGRHVRGKGFATDRTKFNLGLSRGWAVFEFCDDHLRDRSIDENVRLVIQTIQLRCPV